MTTIRELINIPAGRIDFEFGGRKFQYHPAADGTMESLITTWADAPRYATATPGISEHQLRQQVDQLLTHQFRRGMSRSDIDATLQQVRASFQRH